MQQPQLDRRSLLRGALATAALAGTASFAGCAGSASDTPASSGAPAASGSGSAAAGAADNPFGVAQGSKVEAVVFNGGYGIDYAENAGKIMSGASFKPSVQVAPSTQIGTELQPRFAGGNPPDVIDNSGKDLIGISAIVDQLEDLSSVIDAKNLEGGTIRDTLYNGVLEPGTIDGKLAVINYVLTVYATWYSSSLFEENGWTPPKTWEEAYELGTKAKAKNKFLFLWGKEAATYYQTMAIGSAIKEGGDETRLALDNMQANCWSQKPVQDVFTAMKKIIDAGMVKPGGSGTQFTAAQAQWSNNQDALLYPSGSWIENEMKKQTKDGFKMMGLSDFSVTDAPKLGAKALHSTAGEGYIVPSKAANPAGGKEFMRVMLSKEAATNFAKTKLAPTIVKDTVPTDAFGSTALASQIKLLEEAGDAIYSWQFVDYYGTNKDQLVLWNSFLDGKMDVATLTKELQKITDTIREDSSIKKYTAK
ncbi:N-acetylglucosamine/diacetylchitobiose ABC transporter substrate-binding protein [Luteococcus peritonei]|uniref:N-acetylglucosamine/diacetylchitobiose ABC transporter substrate-binding protein n=1 Tax=Luteococcus peritonei TaxID=88874 RepID=A0ABW4RUY1_9ACTN